jgi:hypothetical protein
VVATIAPISYHAMNFSTRHAEQDHDISIRDFTCETQWEGVAREGASEA